MSTGPRSSLISGFTTLTVRFGVSRADQDSHDLPYSLWTAFKACELYNMYLSCPMVDKEWTNVLLEAFDKVCLGKHAIP